MKPQTLELIKKAYDICKPLPAEYGSKDRVHDAVYDCIRSSWYTWQALRWAEAAIFI